jgi:hypothetical protein
MKVLAPREELVQPDGKFPCGRKSGYEHKEFRMPQTECNDCKLEMIFSFNKTESVTVCADIKVVAANKD